LLRNAIIEGFDIKWREIFKWVYRQSIDDRYFGM